MKTVKRVSLELFAAVFAVGLLGCQKAPAPTDQPASPAALTPATTGQAAAPVVPAQPPRS